MLFAPKNEAHVKKSIVDTTHIMPSPYICSATVAPLRREPSDTSEMVSQLLFGETFEVLEERPKWHRVRGTHDGYEGWMDPKQGTPLDETETVLAQLKHPTAFTLGVANTIWRGEYERRFLVLGSPLHGMKDDEFVFLGQKWTHEGEYLDLALGGPEKSRRLQQVGIRYLNAPYLWGGRSPFGIDCSGLTQMVYRFVGISLPRDAWQQALEGKPVSFSERQVGDLAFFENESGRVVHVGLVFPEGWILHASGEVRLDRLSPDGIYRENEGRWSHNLSEIRRVE